MGKQVDLIRIGLGQPMETMQNTLM